MIQAEAMAVLVSFQAMFCRRSAVRCPRCMSPSKNVLRVVSPRTVSVTATKKKTNLMSCSRSVAVMRTKDLCAKEGLVASPDVFSIPSGIDAKC